MQLIARFGLVAIICAAAGYVTRDATAPDESGFIGCVGGHVEIRNITITGLANDRTGNGIIDLSGIRCATEEEKDAFRRSGRDPVTGEIGRTVLQEELCFNADTADCARTRSR